MKILQWIKQIFQYMFFGLALCGGIGFWIDKYDFPTGTWFVIGWIAGGITLKILNPKERSKF